MKRFSFSKKTAFVVKTRNKGEIVKYLRKEKINMCKGVEDKLISNNVVDLNKRRKKKLKCVKMSKINWFRVMFLWIWINDERKKLKCVKMSKINWFRVVFWKSVLMALNKWRKKKIKMCKNVEDKLISSNVLEISSCGFE